jgi:penicillin-binding protein 1C
LRPASAQAARAAILSRLAATGWISAARAADAAEEALPGRRNAFPAEAWHAADTIRAHGQGAPIVRSTLDLVLQREAERLVTRLADEGGPGVQAAAIVVEIETRAVRAAVGSAGRERAGGWIDLTQASRSPGSTLKPLVYALAFDDGAAAPDMLIDDLPARFSNYRPENFDRAFRGEVTVADALQHSLNVPAVRVLDRVGAARFAAALDQAGAHPSIPGSLAGETGLAVALGGLGLSVRDLALLYAALGDEGRARPLAWTLDEAAANTGPAPGRIVTAESARDILEVLYGSPAPPGRMPAHLTLGAPRVAYKTGTSYGFRDAWAVGVSGGYALVVWTGRPDGAPRPGVTGRAGALPTLFDLADAVARWDPAFENDAPQRAPAYTPPALARFAPSSGAPVILFPPESSELWAQGPGRGFVLSARGAGPLAWYVDGAPVARDAGGAAVFSPDAPGFYALTVVDAQGRSARTAVRVRMADSG